MPPPANPTPAGGYRFIPIEANTATPPTSSGRRRTVNPKTQPVEGGSQFGLYQIPPPTPAPSTHFNPQSAHPYFFPPTLAHQPGAHLPITNPPPPAQDPTPPTLAPNPAFSTPPNNPTTLPNGAPRTADPENPPVPPPHTTSTPDPSVSSPPDPSTPKSKKQNSANRPLSHPNPHVLGLTRISPPPECHYPNAEIAATVIHAWSTSRNFKLSRQKSDKNAAGEVYKQYYLCSRHGRPTNTHKVTPETRQRRQRKSERIGCPMGIVVRAVDAGNVAGDWTVRWQLEGKSEWHNHGPQTEEEVRVEDERRERNERRKAARGSGGGKRGRRPKNPTKPVRKRDRRKGKEGDNVVDGAVDGDIAGTGAGVVGIGNGVGNGVDMGGVTGAEQQLQQEHAQQLQHELSGSLHTHELITHQQQQQQQQPQQQDHSGRPLPTLWTLNEMMGHHQSGNGRGRLEEQSYGGFARNGGMMYGSGQSGMGYR